MRESIEACKVSGIGIAMVTGDLALARTIAFCVLSLSQLFHAFNARHLWKSVFAIGPFGNPWLLAAFGFGAVVQLVVVAVPAVAAFFKTVPLSLAEWAMLFGLSATTLLLNELAKLGMRISIGARARRARA